MLTIEKNVFCFRIKEIHFSEYPYDVDGCHVVNFPLCKNKIETDGFTMVESLTSVIDLTQDLDAIWLKLDKKSSRYSIKRAQRYGIKVRINRDYDDFYRINKNLLKKKGFSLIYAIGIPNTKTMKRYGTLFTAEYEGEILGGHLYLEDESNILLWYSASKRLEADREKAIMIGRTNRLLHWEAIKYAKEKGIKKFDWGGLFLEEEANKDETKKSLNSFKLSFGGEIVTCHSYQKLYSKTFKQAQLLYNFANR